MNFDEWWKDFDQNKAFMPVGDLAIAEHFARSAWEASRNQLDPETMSKLCGRYMAQYRDKEQPNEHRETRC